MFGYALVAAMALAGLFTLWKFVIREQWGHRRRRMRGERERLARQIANAEPACKAE